MKKILKFLFYSFTSLVVVLLLVVAYITFVIDPNDYKDDIALQASKATGRDIELTGDLSISLFPWLGFELGQVSVGNAAGFGGDFARITNAGAAVKLLPLLSKSVEIQEVLLDGMQLNLQVDANGRDNWSDIGAGSDSPGTTADNGSTQIESLSIAAIRISNTGMTLDNAQTGQKIVVRDVNLNATDIASGKPVDLAGGLELELPDQQAAYGLDINGKLRYSADTGLAELLQMALQVSDRSTAPLPDIALMANGTLNVKSGSLDLSSLELSADELELSGSVSGQNVTSAPTLNGIFELAPLNPRQVALAFGADVPELADSEVLETFSGQLELAVTPGLVSVNKLQATLDETTLSGNVTMTRSERPEYRFAMNVNQIDLDRYLPKATEESGRQQTGNGSAAVSTIPVETFRSIDANGELSIGAVTINNLNATDVSVSLDADRNGWRFQPVQAGFYDGQFNGAIHIDARGDSPVLRTDDLLNGVVARALLKDMLDTEFLAGSALFDADIQVDINQPVETLNGEVRFDINDGAIYGINVADLLRKGFSLANNLGSIADIGSAATLGEEFLQGGGQTDFASLSGNFLARDGVITNNDLKLQSPLLRVTGAGTVDLPNNTLDYSVSAALVKSLEGQGGDSLEDLMGKEVPIRITGSLDDPKYSVDPAVILQILAGDQVQALKDDVLGAIGDKLGGEENPASGLLDGVLNQALGTKPTEEVDTEDDSGSDKASDQESTEEAVAGALLNSIFGKKREPEESDEEDDN